MIEPQPRQAALRASQREQMRLPPTRSIPCRASPPPSNSRQSRRKQNNSKRKNSKRNNSKQDSSADEGKPSAVKARSSTRRIGAACPPRKNMPPAMRQAMKARIWTDDWRTAIPGKRQAANRIKPRLGKRKGRKRLS